MFDQEGEVAITEACKVVRYEGDSQRLGVKGVWQRMQLNQKALAQVSGCYAKRVKVLNEMQDRFDFFNLDRKSVV